MNAHNIRDNARLLSSGQFGSFAAAIGEAMLLADSKNFARLVAAFPDLILKASEHARSEEERRAASWEFTK